MNSNIDFSLLLYQQAAEIKLHDLLHKAGVLHEYWPQYHEIWFKETKQDNYIISHIMHIEHDTILFQAMRFPQLSRLMQGRTLPFLTKIKRIKGCIPSMGNINISRDFFVTTYYYPLYQGLPGVKIINQFLKMTEDTLILYINEINQLAEYNQTFATSVLGRDF